MTNGTATTARRGRTGDSDRYQSTRWPQCTLRRRAVVADVAMIRITSTQSVDSSFPQTTKPPEGGPVATKVKSAYVAAGGVAPLKRLTVAPVTGPILAVSLTYSVTGRSKTSGPSTWAFGPMT